MNLSKKNTSYDRQKKTKEKSKKKFIKINPLDEDVALHKKMVNDIKDPIWKKYNY